MGKALRQLALRALGWERLGFELSALSARLRIVERDLREAGLSGANLPRAYHEPDRGERLRG